MNVSLSIYDRIAAHNQRGQEYIKSMENTTTTQTERDAAWKLLLENERKEAVRNIQYVLQYYRDPKSL